jgi:hypothetical protein
MREITERDAAGRLISKFYGDPLAWMTPFMGAGRVARINKTSDRSD